MIAESPPTLAWFRLDGADPREYHRTSVAIPPALLVKPFDPEELARALEAGRAAA